MVSAARPTTAVTEIDTLNLARADITTIIWATGYTYDYHWVKMPVFDERGHPHPAARTYGSGRPVFPRAALDAHHQIRAVLRRRPRRGIPRRPDGTHTLTPAGRTDRPHQYDDRSGSAGGGAGIRTLGGLHLTRFRGVLLRPLGHATARQRTGPAPRTLA